jgi:hypothetical protein
MLCTRRRGIDLSVGGPGGEVGCEATTMRMDQEKRTGLLIGVEG